MSETLDHRQPKTETLPAPFTAQAPSAAVRVVRERLKVIYRGLTEILGEPSSTLLELKRKVNLRLEFDPTPEQLQLFSEFSRVADPEVRDLCVRTLSVHLLLTRVLEEYAVAPCLRAGELRSSLELLPVLQATSRRLDAEFRRAIEAVDRIRRDELVKLQGKLERPDAPLQAALVLGPELARLAECCAQGDLPTAAPSLSDDELALIRESVQGTNGGGKGIRERLDGIAMRTLIEGDLEHWGRLPEPGENDTAALAERMRLFARLEQDKQAYRVVADELNEARAHNFSSARAGADDMRRTQQRLFAAYRALNRVINAGPMHVPSAQESTGEPGTASGRLRSEMLAAERAGAEVDAERQARQALVQRAVSGGEVSTPRPEEPRSLRDLKGERKRRKILIGVAAALAPISLAVNLYLHWDGSGKPRPTAETFQEALPVKNVLPAMAILQAEVSAFLWENMSPEERVTKVESVARIAAEDGYTDVIIVDESDVEVARWSRGTGVQLIESTATE